MGPAKVSSFVVTGDCSLKDDIPVGASLGASATRPILDSKSLRGLNNDDEEPLPAKGRSNLGTNVCA